jgi:hypothetical protein
MEMKAKFKDLQVFEARKDNPLVTPLKFCVEFEGESGLILPLLLKEYIKEEAIFDVECQLLPVDKSQSGLIIKLKKLVDDDC